MTQAAHHIAITYAAAIFMFPLGMSFASCILVGNAMGRGDVHAAARMGWNGTVVAALMMLVFAVFTGVMREVIPTWFVGQNQENASEVIAMASAFLIVVALFHVFDGIQVMLLGALRGLADVRYPAVLMFLVFWLLGLPCGAWMAFGLDMEGMGIWWSLMGSLVILSVILPWRFSSQLKRIAESEATAVDA